MKRLRQNIKGQKWSVKVSEDLSISEEEKKDLFYYLIKDDISKTKTEISLKDILSLLNDVDKTSLSKVQEEPGLEQENRVRVPRIQGAILTEFDLSTLEDSWFVKDGKLHIPSGYNRGSCGVESEDGQYGYDNFDDICRTCLVRVHIDRPNQHLKKGESAKIQDYIKRKLE